MNREFDAWWNSDHLPPNPYPKDSPVFWAWAGWQMAAKAEREACAKVCDAEVVRLDLTSGPRAALVAGICAAAIRERGQEPPR